MKMERMSAMPRMNDQDLDRYCWEWNRWCFTRRYYIAPGSKNLLARMQPAKINEPPDAALSQDMSYFHMAIHALADMEGSDPECFIAYYALVQQNKLPIKVVASKLGVSVRTFYERKTKFARKALSLASSLKATKEAQSQSLDCDDNLD